VAAPDPTVDGVGGPPQDRVGRQPGEVEGELDPYAERGRWCAAVMWIQGRPELGAYAVAFDDAEHEIARRLI
jgi:hypothetical protein